MTELQWKEWKKTLPGRWVHWEGEVYQVEEDGDVYVSLPYDEAIGVCWLKGLPLEQVRRFSKEQEIEFIGRIVDYSDFLGLGVDLKDVTILRPDLGQ